MENTIREKWNEVLNFLKEDPYLGTVSYDTWIAPLTIHSFDEKTGILTLLIHGDKMEDRMAASYVNKRYSIFIQVAVEEITGIHCEIQITTPDSVKKKKEEVKKIPQAAYHVGLNPRYTFENFVVGRNNSHAHAASLAVAERPGDEFNPLFIYGGPGLGKTHLLHAIAHFMLKENPQAKVVMVSCEKFTNDLIDSLYNNRKGGMSTEEFREKYRKADALLIDDIQFIINKESTQEELFNTFNTLYESKKQIVFSSDRPPKEFVTLEERLTTRFGWGPIVDIGLPDYETRVAILRKKEEMLREEGKQVNIDNQVIQYIAANVVSDIRNLEGSIQKIMLLAKLKNIRTEDVDLEQAKEVLKDVINPHSKREITSDYIIEVVSNHYHVNPSEVMSKRRSRNILIPRQISQYLIRDMIGMTFDGIGEIFNQDHSTVMHSVEKLESSLSEDEELKKAVDTLIKKINPG